MVATAFDRLTSQVNLAAVWKEYRPRAINSAAGINGLSPKDFDHDAKFYIKALSYDLRDGFCFSKLRGVKAPKSDPTKFRIICVPTIQDRLVQRAILKEIDARAIKLGIANEVSFGFVKDTATVKRGTGTARDVAIKHRRKKPWAFKADIESFFDRIDRKSLSEDFARKFSLTSLASLVVGAIGCEVDDTDPRIKRVLQENGIVAGRESGKACLYRLCCLTSYYGTSIKALSLKDMIWSGTPMTFLFLHPRKRNARSSKLLQTRNSKASA